MKCEKCLKKDVCGDYQTLQNVRAHLRVAKIIDIECNAFLPLPEKKTVKKG